MCPGLAWKRHWLAHLGDAAVLRLEHPAELRLQIRGVAVAVRGYGVLRCCSEHLILLAERYDRLSIVRGRRTTLGEQPAEGFSPEGLRRLGRIVGLDELEVVEELEIDGHPRIVALLRAAG